MCFWESETNCLWSEALFVGQWPGDYTAPLSSGEKCLDDQRNIDVNDYDNDH